MSLPGFNNWRGLSLSQESAYGTPAAIDHIEKYLGDDPLELMAILDDGREVTVGYEESIEAEVLGWKTQGRHRQRATFHGLVYWLAYAFGHALVKDNGPDRDIQTGSRPKTLANGITAADTWPITVHDTEGYPDSGKLWEAGAGAFTYTSKTATTFAGSGTRPQIDDNDEIVLAQNAPITLPSMTITEHVGLASQYQFPGMIVSRLALEVTRRNFVTIEVDLVGDGNRNAVSESKPSFVSDVFLKGGDASGLVHA